MNYFDKYNRRLWRFGKNSGESFHNSTINFINTTFHASPTFRVLKVSSIEFPDINEIDARVIEIERMGTLREVLFRPRQGLNIGTYVEFEDDTWLAYDKWGSLESANLKLLIQKCNRILQWKNLDGSVVKFDCVASATPLGSKSNQGKNDIEWNKYDVRLPIGQLFIFVSRNELTKHIRMNQRFIIGSNVYEVFGIDETTLVDKSGFGVIQFTVKISTKHNKDDFETGIAYDKYEVIEPVQGITSTGDDDEEGGRIW
jgi:hypothetical protein